MNWKDETILRIISAVCQFYYASYSATSLYLAINLTLPQYCSGDEDSLQFMTFILWFIFLNMMGNFVCIIYKAKLSIVKRPPNAERHLAELGISSTYQGHINSSVFTTNYSDGKTNNFLDPMSMNNNYSDPSYSFVKSDDCNVENRGSASLDSQDSSDVNDSSSHERTNDVEILGGWCRCKDCFALTPPRGKHCPLCKHCVLKRDHHCYFVGHCIGFHNQRFFICFCLYGGLGGLYSMWLTSHYLRTHYEALQTWGWPAYIGPFAIIHWALGYTSGAMLGLVMFWWWSIFTSAMGCCYCYSQILLVIRGQTKWEFFQDKWTYRGTLRDNVHSVFGKFWPLCFLVPAPFLGYVGDGANWDNLNGNWKNL